MPRRRRLDKRRNTELNMEEEFELVLGPHGLGESVFPGEDARRAAWEAHRDELLAEFPNGCWAGREYDDPDPDEDAAWCGRR